MKKCMLIALITIFVLSASAALCFAQTDRSVTNTSKKGSLLIWPLIKVDTTDTLISLSNEYYQGVRVRCAYRAPFPCSHTDWVFTLKPNQPISWLASTGKGLDGKAIPKVKGTPPRLAVGTSATLECWAVDSGGSQQIVWNWLTGDAIVGKGGSQPWEYSAWRFAVNSSTTGANAGTAGRLQLTGDTGNYDACPSGLLFNFFKQTPSGSTTYAAGTVNNILTLVPCGQDLTTNGNTIVYTDLVTRDENGISLTGPAPYACIGCSDSSTLWFSESLTSSKLKVASTSVNPFVYLTTPGGSFVIHGKQSTSCTGSTGVPLLGVMSMQFGSTTGPVVGVTPTAIGPGQGYVKDANDNYTTTPISIAH